MIFFLCRGAAYIEGYNETSIRHVVTNLEEGDANWSVNVSVFLANNSKNIINGSLQIKFLNQVLLENVSIEPNTDGEFVYHRSLNISKVSCGL